MSTRTTDSNGYFIESPTTSIQEVKPIRGNSKRIKAIRQAYKRAQLARKERNKLQAINTLLGTIKPVWSLNERKQWQAMSGDEQRTICLESIPPLVSVKDANIFLSHRRIALDMETSILGR